MVKKVYRVGVIVGEFDADGFWNVKETNEMASTKQQLEESLDKLTKTCKDYIKERLV